MWNRKELKKRGKAAFQKNYWKCVLVALIFTLLVSGGAASSKKQADGATEGQSFVEVLKEAPREVVGILAGAVAGVAVIGSVVNLLVVNPLKVGCKRFFVVNSEGPAELDELLYGFKNGYGGVVVTMLLRDLFTALWFCLFIVPGVVKLYSYRMVPYILAEEPGVGATEAITRSRQMMKGNKWKAFVLDLSFLGWFLLAALTCGVVNVLWTQPYVEATDAELYKAIR